jgi:hypothetical protein
LWDLLMMSSAALAATWLHLSERAQIISLAAVLALHAAVFLWVASRKRSA